MKNEKWNLIINKYLFIFWYQLEKKLKLKDELLRKIQEDENERMKLENLLARVERDELDIIKKFKGENDEGGSNKENLEMAYNVLRLRNQNSPNRYLEDDQDINYQKYDYQSQSGSQIYYKWLNTYIYYVFLIKF